MTTLAESFLADLDELSDEEQEKGHDLYETENEGVR